MLLLTDYLYGNHTIPNIVYNYAYDLRKSATKNKNAIDLAHSSFMLTYLEFLESNEFLITQSNKLHEFYTYMEQKYPFLAFTFKGRIKSLLRVEEKYNAYIIEYILKYYQKYNAFPSEEMINNYLQRFSDLIAYRIVLSIPPCNLMPGEVAKEVEINYLYQICNEIPSFLQERGFDLILVSDKDKIDEHKVSDLLIPEYRDYVKDYVFNPKNSGYQSLHLCLFDNSSRCKIETQLRTKDMDDFAEIGKADHKTYVKLQKEERLSRKSIPKGKCLYFDDAYTRIEAIHKLDFTKISVNMFTAYSNILINDQSGLISGRLITPYEHLSKFQN